MDGLASPTMYRTSWKFSEKSENFPLTNPTIYDTISTTKEKELITMRKKDLFAIIQGSIVYGIIITVGVLIGKIILYFCT